MSLGARLFCAPISIISQIIEEIPVLARCLLSSKSTISLAVLSRSMQKRQMRELKNQCRSPRSQANALPGKKSHLCIPFLGIARPQSQFPNLCVCERFICIFPELVRIFSCSRIGRRYWKYINRRV
jgi:hypothetical protein